MPLINSLKVQVDTPVWEYTRFAPVVSATLSCSCSADNSTFTAQHGRYIYYLINSINFFRYDTWSDAYQQLASPTIAPLTFTSMRFAGAQGYNSRVISATSNTLQAALLTGAVFKGFDIRILNGTGAGQQRVITDVSDVVMLDTGTASAATASNITDSTKAWGINQWVGHQIKIVLGTGAIQTRKVLYNSATVITFSDANKYAEDVFCNTPIVATAPLAIPVIGSVYQIESSTLTIDSAWNVTPDATSRFVIQTGGIYLLSGAAATPFYTFQYYDLAADQWYIRNASGGPIAIAGTDACLERCGENASVWDRGLATSGTITTLVDTTKAWIVNQFVGYWVRILSGTGNAQLRLITSNTVNTLSWIDAGTALDATSRYSIEGFDAGTITSATPSTATASGTTSNIAGNILTVGGTINGVFLPGQVLSGTGVSALYNATNSTSTAAVVTVSSTANIYVGQVMTMVSGTGTLAAGVTTVIQVNSATTFTISQAPTVALSGTNVFVLSGGASIYTSAAGATSSSALVTVTNTANLVVGMGVIVTSGVGTFVPGSLVTNINSTTTFTVSVAPSVALSGGASIVVGTFPLTTYISSQLTGAAGGAGTYSIFPAQNVVSTTITATGISSLVDTTKAWATNRWNNFNVRITGGTGAGQLRTITTTTSNTLAVQPAWLVAPDNTSTYAMQGDFDTIMFAIGGQTPIFTQGTESDLLTLGREFETGVARGFSSQYGPYPAVACSNGVFASGIVTVTTTNPHNYQTGFSITHRGDIGTSAVTNNITAIITITGPTTYTYAAPGSTTSVTIPAQSTLILVDASKTWIANQWAGHLLTFNPAQGPATAVTTVQIVGNNSNTLYFAGVSSAPLQGVSRYAITPPAFNLFKNCIGTMPNGSGLAIGVQSTGILTDQTKLFTSAATSCSSSGLTITTTGNTVGLQVGMFVAVTAGTGAFAIGAGTNYTLVTVTGIISNTTFTVSSVPTTTLAAATVLATFWLPSMFVNRRVRILSSSGIYQESIITANTANTLTYAVAVAAATGQSSYAILQAPPKGVGISLSWASGQSDLSKRGRNIYLNRGGALLGIDRLDITTDTWELTQTSPNFETLSAGSMSAYDGGDRLYFTKEVTQRMYYLDIDKNTIHPAGQYPYLPGVAIIGNRMEIFVTVDGLKYLWLNRHSNLECFKVLLFF